GGRGTCAERRKDADRHPAHGRALSRPLGDLQHAWPQGAGPLAARGEGVSAPIWIGEKDVQLDLGRAIALLRKAMTRQAAGAARNMEKTHVAWDGGTLHAIGAIFTDTSLLGVKTWAHTPKGATPLEILWDAETGKLLAVIEAFAMGQLRTAGMAGLATDCLAARDADVFAICGTGKQSMAQVAAVKAVRKQAENPGFRRQHGRRGVCWKR